jgi:hypothetical protein
MATLHVRNVPDPLYEALRECADSAGRSIGAQTVEILTDALVPRRGGRRVIRRRMVRRPMFERFSEQGRSVIVLAQDEARGLAHDYLGTEHLLLGLLRLDTSGAARALAELGVDQARVRARVEELVGRGPGTPSGAIPFTPRAKKVLELALRESLALRHDDIETEHLLLAILAEGEGVAARILSEQGLDAARARGVVLNLLAGRSGARLEIALPPEPVEHGYLAVDLEGAADAWTERLNQLADEGWELVSLQQLGTGTRAVFRRAE